MQNYRINTCLFSNIFEKRFGLVNFFINECIRENDIRPEWVTNQFIPSRLQSFIFRVDSMNIPKQVKDTISGFLEIQRAKAALARTKKLHEDSWLVPNATQGKNLHMVCGVPKYIPDNSCRKWGRKVSLAEATANTLPPEEVSQKFEEFERFRLIHQLNSTGNKFPELRLGQLISNSLPEGTDIFYVTDAKLIQLLKDFEVQHGLP